MIETPDGILDADDYTDLRHGPFVNPPVEDSPIVFLGHYSGRVVFCMPEGEIRDIATGDVPRLLETDLFNSMQGQTFLAYWRDREGKFQRNAATIWFIRQCRKAGYWERNRLTRSLGVWPADDGGVILHCGDELLTFRAGQPVQTQSVFDVLRAGAANGPIYRLRGKAPRPAESAEVADGQWVRDMLDMWRFELIGEDGLTGADLVAGWLIASLMGAVAPFRPHMLLYAQPGSGKTTLIRFLHGLLSALTGDVLDSFTPAGLRSDLSGMARPVLIDEAEASPSAMGLGPVEQALDLIRRMATGEGAVRKMGDVGGQSVTQTAVGAVFMAAVNAVRLSTADQSRIAEAKITPLNRTPDRGELKPRLATDAELDKALARARDLAPRLLGRVLHNADRFRADAAQIKAAFIRQRQSPRSGDLVAALAAGRRLLLSDEPLDERSADDEARFWSGLLTVREQAGVVANSGSECLAHLLTSPSGKHVHDRVVSLGDLVEKAAARDGEIECDNVLKGFGLKVVHVRDDDSGAERPVLMVANHHPVLTRIFERTPWPDWRRALTFLDDLGEANRTWSSDKAIRFGPGVQQRAICIPLDPHVGTRRPNVSHSRPGQANE